VNWSDPRVKRAVEYNGPDWVRNYESGNDVPTADLSGTCFAVRTADYKMACNAMNMNRWGKGSGEDIALGEQLGRGVVLSGIYAYEFGRHTAEEWGVADMAWQLQRKDIALYRRVMETLS
jgi:hypothetical protein